MDLDLRDKVFLVTGGAKGIGASITRALAEDGAVPVILGRNPEEAAELQATLQSAGQRCLTESVELTDPRQIEAAVRAVASATGRIDGIVNNAGVNDSVGLDAGPAGFEESLRRNLVHYYAVVHFALGELRRSRGTIVNITSKVSFTGQGGTSAYAAAKGGVNALTREWALELAGDGIRVNAVVPAEVWTPLYAKFLGRRPDPEAAKREIEERIPLGRRFTECREIADTVVFLLSPRSSHTTGQILFVDGGYTHLDRMFGALDPAP